MVLEDDHRMKRKLTLALSLLLLAGIAVGCSKPNTVYQNPAPAEETPEPTVTLKIGQIPTIDSLPFWVAEDKDYYRQQGVNVELVNFRSPSERDAALQSGQIDGTFTDIMGAVTVHTKGTPLQITSTVLGVKTEEGPFAIIAAPNSGITKPEQLKGVEVAISNNSVIHYTTEKMLQEQGFTADEIKTIAIPQIPMRFENLMAGSIQAATLPEPFISLAASKGAHVVLNDAEAKGGNYSQSVIAFTEKAIQEKAEGIKAFYFAYNLAVFDIQRDPAAFKELLATRANLPAEIKDSWNPITFSPAQAPGRAEIDAVVDWLLEKGYITEKVAYEEIVNETFYPKAQ